MIRMMEHPPGLVKSTVARGRFGSGFWDERLIEWTKAVMLFTNPGDKQTEDYITGRFG